jgi:hypothetical protein
MERRLNLIKNQEGKSEKRVFPRYPLTYLIFKSMKEQANSEPKLFEVIDISETGMQLEIKAGKHDYHINSVVTGSVHWKGEELEVNGKVIWTTPRRVGVEFDETRNIKDNVSNFLNLKTIVEYLKPLHREEYGIELPGKLKYWLRADGPVELFVWQHSDGEISKFQVLIFDQFIEWEDAVGIKTGRLLSKRDADTPLISEDEFIFQIDTEVDPSRTERGSELISLISEDLLNKTLKEFLQVKLGH